ncbi:hypothetical protein ZYGR_0A01890 [Zygosaccharomyces rouxii]|uniref:ZYRO0A04290p n=2 Tax=Zygosaccharomyces rouxii TaxID=4956 RepID=C5DPL3_ZYGRC|nr:uncharacterized protein ZYRO0A04290g [Zygosaccharomyces rouxii]KAH9198856.1 hypothetical protein LQ764DRAFT_142621 [Zygosaccharomyces rouxii]GAV46597.1 hypothetical protein ZYGR_0A01890 [Zygosaccharomyces rouxii]CAR25624.1 ZYRO0A04290p [Zygosaccharomyces rouxii]
MQEVLFKEHQYIQRGKSLKRYISKLRNVLKNNRLAGKAKKDLEVRSQKKEKPKRNSLSSKRKRSLTSANNTNNITPTRKETQSAKKQDSPKWKRQKRTSRDRGRTSSKKRRDPHGNCDLLASEQSENPHNHADSPLSRRSKNSKSYNRRKHSKEAKNLTLDDIQEHPMLQQELVANINGSYIQFHLVSVDPKLLLQGPPVITTEPMPSLIWPYD